MCKPFDPSKPVQTRDGRKARIICTDAEGVQPIVALVYEPSGVEAQMFNGNGLFHPDTSRESVCDLINVEPEVVEYRNVYDNAAKGMVPWWSLDRTINQDAKRAGHWLFQVKRTRQGSRVISMEVVEFAKEIPNV
jgi:hypothetical protein